MIELTLPMPPSANHYKKPRRNGGWYLTPEAIAFLYEVKLRTQYLDEGPFVGPVSVIYRFFRGARNGKLQRGDMFNYEKVLSDSLQGIAYQNDSQIRDAIVSLREDRERPRVEVMIWPTEKKKRGRR